MPKSCVIFDFDGVIADTERLHLAAYNRAFEGCAADIGAAIEIAPASYFTHYIVYGDREAIVHMLRDHKVEAADDLVDRIVESKGRAFHDGLGTFAKPLPGVRKILAWLEERNIPRAICSGARRDEIVMLLEMFQLRHHFDIVVAIEDVAVGKPNPEGYNKAFDLLNQEFDAALDKGRSIVIEDSAGGCAAAKSAGLRVLGVATSLPLEQVERCATFAVQDLNHLDTAQLTAWLGIDG